LLIHIYTPFFLYKLMTKFFTILHLPIFFIIFLFSPYFGEIPFMYCLCFLLLFFFASHEQLSVYTYLKQRNCAKNAISDNC